MTGPYRLALVTGATGFFGAHVSCALLEAGWRVMAACRAGSDTGRLRRLTAKRGNLSEIQMDLADLDAVDQTLRRTVPELVVNCAAYGVDHRQQTFATAVAVNVTAADRLVSAAAAVGVGRFIHVGTSAEYGAGGDDPISEQCPLRPQGVYGVSKASGTLAVLSRAAIVSLPLVVIRLFGMFGPLQGKHKFVPLVMAACRTGRTLELTSGEQVRDYLPVVDAARACVLLGESTAFPAGEVINLGSGQPTSLRTLGEAVERMANRHRGALVWGARPHRPGEVLRCVADVAKARRLLAWSMSTSLEEGIAETLAYEYGEEEQSA